MSKPPKPVDYKSAFSEISAIVHQARYQSFKAVNSQLVKMYWEIGKIIADRQKNSQWGDGVIEALAQDLQAEFSGVRGFSARNILRMKTFYTTYEGEQIPPTVLAELSWSHHGLLLEKCKSPTERLFYIQRASQQNWSFRFLEKKIKANEFENIGKNQTNFRQVLQQDDAETALLAVKDNYNLDFLELTEKHKERQLEDGIVTNILKFLSEMGGMFSFVGRQVKVELNEKEYFMDLVFYHRVLKCLVVVELKTVDFEPEHAGKMQFYLTMADEKLRQEGENPSIGIIICRSKDRTLVEYTLRDVSRPVGVASYSYENLPEMLSKYLPNEEALGNTFDL